MYGVVAFGVGALRVSVIVVRLGDHVLIYTPPGYLCQRFVDTPTGYRPPALRGGLDLWLDRPGRNEAKDTNAVLSVE